MRDAWARRQDMRSADGAERLRGRRWSWRRGWGEREGAGGGGEGGGRRRRRIEVCQLRKSGGATSQEGPGDGGRVEGREGFPAMSVKDELGRSWGGAGEEMLGDVTLSTRTSLPRRGILEEEPSVEAQIEDALLVICCRVSRVKRMPGHGEIHLPPRLTSAQQCHLLHTPCKLG
eukprot:758513-Hanusia_phi.AAC.3